MWLKVQRGLYLGCLTLISALVDELLVEHPFPNAARLPKSSTPYERRAGLSNDPPDQSKCRVGLPAAKGCYARDPHHHSN